MVQMYKVYANNERFLPFFYRYGDVSARLENFNSMLQYSSVSAKFMYTLI